MKYISVVIVFIALFFLSNCDKKAEVLPNDYPFVLTNMPIVNKEGAVFEADIINLGNQNIISYGFVWSKEDKPTISDNHKLFNNNATKGIYTLNLKGGLIAGETYNVRACILTQQYEVYGNIVSFRSLGCSPPKIINFEPKFGQVGTQVVIEGENFALSKSENIVNFGHALSIVDSASENRLYVTISAVSIPGLAQVTVKTSGYIATSVQYFDLWFPWKKKSDYPGTYLTNTNNFEVNGKIYVCGGLLTGSFQIMTEFWEYDPANDIWTQKPDFPGTARQNGVSFACNGKGYYGMGTSYSLSNDDYLVDIWEYDPLFEQWTEKTTYPGTPVIYSRTFVIDNKAYLGPGYFYEDSWKTFVSDLWEYDPITNNWQVKNEFPGSERRFGMAIGAGSKGYLGLGSNGGRLDEFYEYDPYNDTWKIVGNYPGNGYNDIASFYIDGKLYFGMGSNNSAESYRDFWEFDLANKNWNMMNPCPTKLSPSISYTINNKGYVGYGWYNLNPNSNIYGRRFYEFNPKKN